MVESCDAQDAASAGRQSTLSADALYKQGMTYYRRQQWRQAQAAFQGLKRVDPGCREIDSLLDELDIFIRLESCTSPPPPQEAPRLGRSSASSLLSPGSAKARRIWVGPVIAGVVVLAFVLWEVANPYMARRVDMLRDRGEALQNSGQWSEAINTYEELVLLVPGDADAKHSLASAYYARGLQRAADAQAFEERQQYREAGQQWEMALADLRAALDIVPTGRELHPSDTPTERIALAQERRHCANLFYSAVQLEAKGHWPEAIEALQSLQAEQPEYRPDDVRSTLSRACLAYGQAAIAAAENPLQVQAGIDLIRQAQDAQPTNAAARLAMERAQVYLEAIASYEAGQWTAAIGTLEPLLQTNPGYAEGRGQSLLCRAYMKRAGELFRAGQVQQALADYQIVSAGTCEEQSQAQEKAAQIALSLTPTPLPLRTATPAHLVSPSLSVTPTLAAGTLSLQPTSP